MCCAVCGIMKLHGQKGNFIVRMQIKSPAKIRDIIYTQNTEDCLFFAVDIQTQPSNLVQNNTQYKLKCKKHLFVLCNTFLTIVGS